MMLFMQLILDLRIYFLLWKYSFLTLFFSLSYLLFHHLSQPPGFYLLFNSQIISSFSKLKPSLLWVSHSSITESSSLWTAKFYPNNIDEHSLINENLFPFPLNFVIYLQITHENDFLSVSYFLGHYPGFIFINSRESVIKTLENSKLMSYHFRTSIYFDVGRE